MGSTHLYNNLISNSSYFPALMNLPQLSASTLPASTASPPAGFDTLGPCSSTTSPPASTRVMPCDVELFVPRKTTVQTDHQRNAMPGPSTITKSNLSSVNCVVGLRGNLTGHGRSHGVMDCCPSSVSGHQHPESQNLSVFPSLQLSKQLHVQPALVRLV